MLEHNIVVYAYIKRSIISMSINNAFDEWETSKTCETHAYLAYAKTGKNRQRNVENNTLHHRASDDNSMSTAKKNSSTLVCVHRVYALIKLIVLGFCFIFCFGKNVTLSLVCFNRTHYRWLSGRGRIHFKCSKINNCVSWNFYVQFMNQLLSF